MVPLDTKVINVHSTTQGDRAEAPNMVYLITDGVSNVDKDQTLTEAALARESDIHVIVGSIENDVMSSELKGLASRPHEVNIINVDRYADLPNIVEQMVAAACDGLYTQLATIVYICGLYIICIRICSHASHQFKDAVR